jgi:hypothetical protein
MAPMLAAATTTANDAMKPSTCDGIEREELVNRMLRRYVPGDAPRKQESTSANAILLSGVGR